MLAAPAAFADVVGIGEGIVRDPSGAVVAGAKIILTRVSTNAVVTRTTGSTGTFRFADLAPDVYTAVVEAPGFKRTTLKQVVIQVDQSTNLDVTLQAGEVTDTVSVDAGAPLIDTQQSTLSNVIDPATVASAPLNSRSFLDLALLTPGATPSAAGSQVTGFNVAGARTQSNDYLIDGISNIDIQVNSAISNFRINDAVQEFSVQTSVPTAEFGRGEGAQVNAVIKSGTNTLHGSAFEYFRNTILDATDYFAKHTPGGFKPVLKRNQFGATVGGPIFRDRTFFFLSYEGFRQVAPTVSLVLVPTTAQRATVTDPISQALLAYFPLPTSATASNGTNYSSNVRSVLNDDTGLVRIDHNLSAKDHLSGHFITYNGRVVTGGQIPTSGGNTNSPLSQSIFVEENHTFSPSLLNTFRVGYSFNQTNFVVQDAGFNAQSIFNTTGGAGGVPLSGVVNGSQNLTDSGLPTVQISGFARLGAATNLPQGRKTRTYEIYDTLTAASLFGSTKHSLKFGFHIRRDDARRFLDGTSRGSLNFTNSNSTTSFMDFAAGNVNTSSLRSGSTLAHFRRYPIDMFAQDAWRVTPSLTLNLGVRYSLPSAIYELNDRGANLIPGQGMTLFGSNQVLSINTALNGPGSIVLTPGATTLTNSGVLTVDKKDISPVVGFAWSPYKNSDKTVLRGGFRIGYDDIFNNIPANLSLNAPFNLTTAQASGTTQPGKFSYATAFNQNVPLVKNIGLPNQVGLLSFNGEDPNIRESYNYAYNVSLEQALTRSFSFEADYIGSLGRKLGVFIDPNQPNVVVNNPLLRGNQSPNVQVFPYKQYGSFADAFGRSAANSNYNGAVAVLKYRGSHGTSFQASYTWSHSLDYSSSFFGSTGDLGYPSDGRNLKGEYGNSSFDLRHRLVAYYNVPLPFGPGQLLLTSSNFFSREAFEGWSVSGITEFQSGLPFTVYLGAVDYSGFNQFADKPNIGVGKLIQNNKNPDNAFTPGVAAAGTVGTQTLTGTGIASPYFGLIGAGQDGNERRDQYYGPGLVNFDLTTQKDFPITRERVKLNFRADLFNVFNHTNFSNPIATATSSSFGKITSTVGNATSGSGGVLGGARLAQFSLRLNF